MVSPKRNNTLQKGCISHCGSCWKVLIIENNFPEAHSLELNFSLLLQTHFTFKSIIKKILART